nr:zinc finger, CCHC-type [Tanacetum cinerariifolium]
MLSRYSSNPSDAHWKAMTRVLYYLRYNHNYGLHYDRSSAVVEGDSDANWISDIKDSRLTNGYVFTLGKAAISWKSSKQSVIAKSTMESKSIALDKSREAAKCLRQFIEDIPMWPKSPLRVRFPRLFALETDKESTVASKLGSSSVDASFRRSVRDGVERQQCDDLNSVSSSVTLSASKERWICDMNVDGVFRVKEESVRELTFFVSLRQRVEDSQLGIESYQTQLNLTKPQWDATGFEYKHDYTVIDSPRAVIFQDKYAVQMMMRFNEIHKFSDGTLQKIDEALDYRVKEFRINRMNPGLNTRFWTRKDVDRCKAFMFVIQRRLRTRRIFRNLESFVGGRLREGDYRLLKLTHKFNPLATQGLLTDSCFISHGVSCVSIDSLTSSWLILKRWQSALASDHLNQKLTIESRAKRSNKIISLGNYSILLASLHTVKSKTDIKSPTHYPCGIARTSEGYVSTHSEDGNPARANINKLLLKDLQHSFRDSDVCCYVQEKCGYEVLMSQSHKMAMFHIKDDQEMQYG